MVQQAAPADLARRVAERQRARRAHAGEASPLAGPCRRELALARAALRRVRANESEQREPLVRAESAGPRAKKSRAIGARKRRLAPQAPDLGRLVFPLG